MTTEEKRKKKNKRLFKSEEVVETFYESQSDTNDVSALVFLDTTTIEIFSLTTITKSY